MDLIYLDPPFNSNENYNIIIRKGNGIPAQMRAFDDTWKWDESAAERVRKITDSVAHPLYSVINGLQNDSWKFSSARLSILYGSTAGLNCTVC